MLKDFYAACCRRLFGESSWNAVPESRLSQRFRAQAYGTVMRLMGTIYDSHNMACNGCPLKLFRLLDAARDKDVVREDLSHDCPKLWDEFAAQICTLSDCEDGLQDSTLVLLLFLLAILLRFIMVPVECRHASLRR